MPSQILLFSYEGVPEKIENWLKIWTQRMRRRNPSWKRVGASQQLGKELANEREKRE